MSETLGDTVPEVVYCVHGTFAGDQQRNDTGSRWWQRGSTTGERLGRLLPPGVALPGEGDVPLFHWSGRNSFAERLDASNQLLARMLEFEAHGRPFHLVGHSHGGSVIWEALVTAQLMHEQRTIFAAVRPYLQQLDLLPPEPRRPLWRRTLDWPDPERFRSPRRNADEFSRLSPYLELSHLRSWTTVGTPFLHYLPQHKPRVVHGWPHRSYSLATVRQSRVLDILFAVAPQTVLIFTVLGVLAALFGSVLIGIAVAIVTFLIATIPLGWESRRTVARSLSERAIAARRAAARFGGRWLGLWAPTDEAISVLSNTVDSGGHPYGWLCADPATRPAPPGPAPSTALDLLPRDLLKLKPPSFAARLAPDAYAWNNRIVAGLLIAFVNRTVMPRLQRRLASMMLQKAQGSDIVGAVLAYVSPTPLPLEQQPSGLPAPVAGRLETQAREQTGALGASVRQAYAQTAINGLPLHTLGATVKQVPAADTALVHTSYFADDDILHLISLHIARTRAVSGLPALLHPHRDLTDWYDQAEAASAAALAGYAGPEDRVAAGGLTTAWPERGRARIGRAVTTWRSRLSRRGAGGQPDI